MRGGARNANRRLAVVVLASSLCSFTLLAGASARQGERGEATPDCAKETCFEVNRVASCQGDNCLEAVEAAGCEEAPCFVLKQVGKCEGERCFQVFRVAAKGRPSTARPVAGLKTQPKRTAVQSLEKTGECRSGTCFEVKQAKGCKVPPCFAAVKKDKCEGQDCFALKKL